MALVQPTPALPFVAERLQKAAELYAQRSAVYGDNYKRYGDMALAVMGGEVKLVTADDFNRFAILTLMLAKISRYANNFTKGGHDDSLEDLSVYSMMLLELDTELRARKAA